MEQRTSETRGLTTDAELEQYTTSGKTNIAQRQVDSYSKAFIQIPEQNGSDTASHVNLNPVMAVEADQVITESMTDINNNDVKDEENLNVTEPTIIPIKDEEEKSHFAHLCRLLLEGSSDALRHVFNLIHPAISLGDRLSKPDVLKVLRRLRLNSTISSKQWDNMYPKQRKNVSSNNYDTPLLTLLLQNICHMPPPYPNGWRGVPLPEDRSIAADVARISYFRKILASKQAVNAADYQKHWSQIAEMLVRLGGTPMKKKLVRLAVAKMQKDEENIWTSNLMQWDNEAGDYKTFEVTPEPVTRDTVSGSAEKTGVQLPRVTRSATVSTSWQDGLSTTVTSGAQLHRAVYSYYRARLPTRSRTRSNDVTSRQMLTQEDRSVLLRFYKQLVDTVKSESVVGKLVQAGILSHEEKNSINLAQRNPNRMKALLGVLTKKSTEAFNTFCDAIKYRHTTLYDQLCKARQQAQLKPDELSECCSYLKSHYRNMYSQFSPVSWHQTATTDLFDFYISPHITDFHGRKVEPGQVLNPHSKCNNPRRVLVEGASGTGKSLLCHYLAYSWANGKFKRLERFKLVFMLDLKRLSGKSLAQDVQEQCLGRARKSVTEIDNLIRAHQGEVLFLLDGYEDISGHSEEEITKVLHKYNLRHCYALLTSNRGYVSGSLAKNFNTRLVLMGLDTNQREILVHKYVSITDTSEEQYERLLATVTSKTDTTVRVMSLNPLLNLCMCLICEMRGALDFNTVSFLLSNFMNSIKKLYCQTNGIKPKRDKVLTENVDNCFSHLAEQASKHITQNRSVFYYELPNPDTSGIEDFGPIFTFGLMHPIPQAKSTDKWCFTNRVFQEYLAGWHLSELNEEDFKAHMDTLINEKHMLNVCMYYCGLLRFKYEHDQLRQVFVSLAEVNQELWQVTPIRFQSSKQGSTTTTSLYSSGTLGDFSLSLRCISEVEGRADLIQPLISSFPPKISMRSREVPDIRVISGLAKILLSESGSITNLDLRLDHFAKYHEDTFLLLADSIERSQSITSLKLYWSNDELLAQFLAYIYRYNTSIKAIRCFDGLRKSGEKISAPAWAQMQMACSHMKNIELFHFMHCKNSALVTSALRNIPFSVQDINLTGSTINQVSAQEISNRLEKSRTIHTLNLSGVELKKADFMYLCQGLRLSVSLKDLNLSDTNLDTNCFSLLSEAVKFNRSILRLDLSQSNMNDDSCKSIGQAMGINKTIRELILIDSAISQAGLQFLYKLKRSNVLVIGVDERNYFDGAHYTKNNMRFSLPAIKLTIGQ